MVRVPTFIQHLFPGVIWRIPTKEKVVFLTFDDGPSESTSLILSILEKYKCPATFFLLGKNVQDFGAINHDLILSCNHGIEHLHGWKTKTATYLSNAKENTLVQHPRIFRPPYGKVTFNQLKKLNKTFQIVQWSILSKDYDLSLSNEKIINNVLENLHNGAIIVLHDQDKLKERIRHILPIIIEKIHAQGYRIERLNAYIKT